MYIFYRERGVSLLRFSILGISFEKMEGLQGVRFSLNTCEESDRAAAF